MTAQQRSSTLSAGDMLNWYRIEGVLGRGGFGVTYLALDTNLDHQVAIKEYLPDQIAERYSDNSVRPVSAEEQPTFQMGLYRFLTEARTLVKFNHPNIVRVLSVFEGNRTAYMVMEFERGQDLKHLLQQPGSNDERFLKKILVPIIDGLNEVHRRGFIHRDIKPANIYIRENQTPVLLDFGAARQALGAQSRKMTAMVSVGYAPLEQYDDSNESQQGPWTDIYALGAVLYYAIAGNPPIESTLRASAFLNDQPDPITPIKELVKRDYSRSFLSAIDWALGFKVLDRPQSLDEWSERLLGVDQTVHRALPISKDGSGLRHRWWKFGSQRKGGWRKMGGRRRSRWWTIIGTLAIGVLGVVIIQSLTGNKSKPITRQVEDRQVQRPLVQIEKTQQPESESQPEQEVVESGTTEDEVAVADDTEPETAQSSEQELPRPVVIETVVPEIKSNQPEKTAPQLQITQSDLQLVSGRFHALKRAIEQKNIKLMDEIAVSSASKSSFFTFVFNNFETVDVSITSITTQPAGQSIFGRLQLGHMVRDNGDRVLPAEQYRSIPLRSERTDGQWSRVIW